MPAAVPVRVPVSVPLEDSGLLSVLAVSVVLLSLPPVTFPSSLLSRSLVASSSSLSLPSLWLYSPVTVAVSLLILFLLPPGQVCVAPAGTLILLPG